MAIPNNYIDKITNKDSGESRIISPAADMVRVENENYEGADLDEVLDEISDAFSEIEQHGLVNGRVPFDEATPVVLASLDGDNTDITPYSEGDYFAVLSIEKIYQVENGAADEVGEIDDKLIYCDKATGNLYRWDYTTNQFVPVGGNSGGGDGTVTGVKMNNGQPISPDENGVVDLGTVITAHQDISGKVDKVTGYGLSKNDYSDADKTKLAGIKAGAEVNVISGIKANGASETLPVENGIVTLPPAGSTISPATAAPLEDGTAGVGSSEKYAREDHRHPHDTTKLSQSDISVETQGDGTVVINVGSGATKDTYTINLNHTHENMAKLVMCEETSLPASLDSNTIYAIVDDETEPMMIEKLVIRGLEFTGGSGVPDTGEPMVITPSDESTINIGTNTEDGLTQTIQIRAKNLEDDLTVEVSGTGLSLSYGQQTGQSVTIPVGSSGKVSTSVDIVFSGWGGTTGSLDFYIGQDLLSSATIVAASDIPSEYTRLEYVDNATKGFLTGVDCVVSKEPFVGTTWELDVQGVSAQSTQILICSTWDTGHLLGEYSGVSGYSMGGGVTFTTPSTTRGVVTVKFISLGLECTFNNETISRTSTTNFNHWQTSTGVIFKTSLLSDMNTDDARANAMVFKGKVYSIKCTSGGNFNGVPAKRNSDNILGIYDKYSDTFYPITT